MSIFKNADPLKNLPTDEEELSIKEKTVLDMLYPVKSSLNNLNSNDEDVKDTNDMKDNEDMEEIKPPSKSLKNVPKDIEKTWTHFNDIIVASLLFIVLNIPLTDRLIEKIVKIDNFYYRLAAKSAIFAVLLFFINNFALSRKLK